MSALSRTLLRLSYGLPPDPDDAQAIGELFDRTPLYGIDEPREAQA